MKRIRRMSVEVIRRELSLSITRRGPTSAEARPGEVSVGAGQSSASSSAAAECVACGSPWLVLPGGMGEEVVLRRLLESQGIHHQMSPCGELFVCARTFALHAAASGIADGVGPEQIQKTISTQSPNHD